MNWLARISNRKRSPRPALGLGGRPERNLSAYGFRIGFISGLLAAGAVGVDDESGREVRDGLAHELPHPAGGEPLLAVRPSAGRGADDDDRLGAVGVEEVARVEMEEIPADEKARPAPRRIERPEAIDALIEILSRAHGEVRGDIAKHLTAISGKPHALDAERWRAWDSCFTVDHSYLHGGSVRSSGRSRYRQWMTHKLATWWDQFSISGCVGCGRCITWCPVGIDITAEARAIRETAGATAKE